MAFEWFRERGGEVVLADVFRSCSLDKGPDRDGGDTSLSMRGGETDRPESFRRLVA